MTSSVSSISGRVGTRPTSAGSPSRSGEARHKACTATRLRHSHDNIRHAHQHPLPETYNTYHALPHAYNIRHAQQLPLPETYNTYHALPHAYNIRHSQQLPLPETYNTYHALPHAYNILSHAYDIPKQKTVCNQPSTFDRNQ